jgi:pimeloyl-ACP methyl ester carboxylesterase
MKKRKTSVQVPKIILFVAKVLQILNSKIALKFALKIFYRPTRFPRPKREDDIYNRAKKDFFIHKDRKIRQYIWEGGSKKILFVHGWSGRGTQLNVLIQSYIDAGFSVFSFDGPAHGESEGYSTHMYELVECIVQMQQIHGDFDYIVGHSMGGIATMNAVSIGVKAKKVSVIGTPNLIRNVIDDFCMNLNLSDEIAENIVEYVEKKHGKSINEVSGEFVGQKMNIPVLIVHDENDVDVLYSEAITMSEKIEKSEIFTTRGLGHRRVLSDSGVVQKMLEFTQG